MEEKILEVVSEIRRGMRFDSHYVIRQLIQHHSDTYLEEFAHSSTELYHSFLSQKVRDLGECVVKRVGDSWSENIHGVPSKCALWEKA